MADRTSIERGGRARGAWAARALLACAGGLANSCVEEADASYPRFGFEVYYELPIVRPDSRCGTDNGGPTTSPWVDGPHDRFAELGPAMLARDSLRWFEHSMQAGAWRGNPTARIELTYPSSGPGGALLVTACQDATSALTWEQQLVAWFERFPPLEEEPQMESDGGFWWTLEYAGRGEIHGTAGTDDEAVEAMRSLHEACLEEPVFERPEFFLRYSERRSSHSMDCYSVDVSAIEELDQLPQLMREKRAQWAGWRSATETRTQ